MTDPSQELCYVALHDCNGYRGVTVICPELVKENPKYVAEWVKSGLRIETWTVERFRKEGKMCECLKKPRQMALK